MTADAQPMKRAPSSESYLQCELELTHRGEGLQARDSAGGGRPNRARGVREHRMVQQVERLDADLGIESPDSGQLRERGVNRELTRSAQDVSPCIAECGCRFTGRDKRAGVEPPIDGRRSDLARSNPVRPIQQSRNASGDR